MKITHHYKSLLSAIISVALFYSAAPHADILDGGVIQFNSFVIDEAPKWTYQTMRKHNKPSLEAERDALQEEVARLNQEIRRQQTELDILKKAEEIIKNLWSPPFLQH